MFTYILFYILNNILHILFYIRLIFGEKEISPQGSITIHLAIILRYETGLTLTKNVITASKQI